jgi:hypothetical protein
MVAPGVVLCPWVLEVGHCELIEVERRER